MQTKAIKIGNLVTELHNVLNRYYENKAQRNRAIADIVTKIYEAGYQDSSNEFLKMNFHNLY